MASKKPFGKKLRTSLVSAFAVLGIGGASTIVVEALPKDPTTDTQYLSQGLKGADQFGPNISVSDQMWKSTLGFKSKAALEREIVEAASTGDSWRVRTLLNGYVAAGSPAGTYALGTATEAKNKDVMRDLLAAGAQNSAAGNAALISYAKIGDVKATAFLLMHDMGVTQIQRDMALIAATQENDTAMMSLLIDFGADVTAGDSAALILAVKRGNEKTVDLLLDRGANPIAQAGTPLRTAQARGDAAIEARLVRAIVSKALVSKAFTTTAPPVATQSIDQDIKGYNYTIRINPRNIPPAP